MERSSEIKEFWIGLGIILLIVGAVAYFSSMGDRRPDAKKGAAPEAVRIQFDNTRSGK